MTLLPESCWNLPPCWPPEQSQWLLEPLPVRLPGSPELESGWQQEHWLVDLVWVLLPREPRALVSPGRAWWPAGAWLLPRVQIAAPRASVSQGLTPSPGK